MVGGGGSSQHPPREAWNYSNREKGEERREGQMKRILGGSTSVDGEVEGRAGGVRGGAGGVREGLEV